MAASACGAVRAARAARADRPRGLELSLSVLIGYMALYGALAVRTVGAAPWNRDEDLRALGSLDRLLAYEEGVQEAVEKAEDAWDRGDGLQGLQGLQGERPPRWQAAEPDPQLYLLTEYDHGQGGPGQGRVKRNRELPAAAVRVGAVRAGGGGLGAASGLRRHARNPPGSSSQRLSIVNPLDVLRQRLLLEIARRRKASVPQSNREMLEGIGKRSFAPGATTPTSTSAVDQAVDRCLAQVGDSRPRDVSRLGLVYWAIAYGKCDLSSLSPSILIDEADQRQHEQKHLGQRTQQLSAVGASRASRPRELREERAEQLEQAEQAQAQAGEARDAEDDWGAASAGAAGARRQANGWSRNVRAAASNYTS